MFGDDSGAITKRYSRVPLLQVVTIQIRFILLSPVIRGNGFQHLSYAGPISFVQHYDLWYRAANLPRAQVLWNLWKV